MLTKSRLSALSYRLFLNKLSELLNHSGITLSRLPVLAELCNNSDRDRHACSPSGEKENQQIGRVIIYIDEHLTEELSLEKLAEEVRLSKYQLIRRFREEEGVTPWKYLVEKRIEHAKELLQNGVSPGQAAVESGFYDQSHMNRSFREETGLTPKEYREKNFRNKN